MELLVKRKDRNIYFIICIFVSVVLALFFVTNILKDRKININDYTLVESNEISCFVKLYDTYIEGEIHCTNKCIDNIKVSTVISRIDKTIALPTFIIYSNSKNEYFFKSYFTDNYSVCREDKIYALISVNGDEELLFITDECKEFANG